MTTTTSKVVFSDDATNALLRKWCDEVARQGGTFSITAHHETGMGWFRVYVINWPDGVEDKHHEG